MCIQSLTHQHGSFLSMRHMGCLCFPPTNKSEGSLKESIPEQKKTIQSSQDSASLEDKDDENTTGDTSYCIRESLVSMAIKETQPLDMNNRQTYDNVFDAD